MEILFCFSENEVEDFYHFYLFSYFLFYWTNTLDTNLNTFGLYIDTNAMLNGIIIRIIKCWIYD